MKEMKASFFDGPSEIHAQALVSQKPISFLGGVNSETGMIIDDHSDIFGACMKGKILIYPFGKGSTGDTLRLWRSCYNGVGPVAIINDRPDPIQVEGALMAEIGVLFGFPEKPTQVFKNGQMLCIKDGVITVEE
jgi:uncharacterized protein